MFKVLIVDDHPLIARGIKMLVANQANFCVLDIIHSIENIWEALKQPIDILILDLNVQGQNTIHIIEEIKAAQPSMKIMIFSSYNKPSLVRKAFEKGVDGYILKDTDEDELIKALNQMIKGKHYIGSKVAIPKKRISVKSRDFEDTFVKKALLSKREHQVMELVIEGFDSQTIADKLFISKNTVQSHRKNIFRKMEVHSVAELIKLLHNL